MNVLLADIALNLGGGRRLILAGAGSGWLWLASGVAAVALVLVLYRYERRLISRRAGLALLGLRLAAAVALVVALFEPIAERTRWETVRGRVVVGVDLSESMSTADPGLATPEADRLAKALNLSPSEPAGSLSRREIARRLIRQDWVKRLNDRHDVEWIAFAREPVESPSAVALSERMAKPPEPDDPNGLVTDWRPVLDRAPADRVPPVLRVFIQPDGRQYPPAPAGAYASAVGLAARGVPVFPVLIGSTDPPRDAAVAAVKWPDRVSKGDVADVEVTLKLDGEVPGAEVPVVLERPGLEPIRKTVTKPEGDARPTATFRVLLDEPGTQPLTVSVGPVEGDLRPDNDRRTVAVEVTDDTARVLLLDGEARWEFRYLLNALKRDPHVQVESVVFHQPPAPPSADPSYPSLHPPPPTDGPDPLNSYDAIVVGDVSPDDLPPAAWRRLESYVDARGGTLILSAGPRSWEPLAADATARKLLPVLDPRPLPVAADAFDPDHPSLPPGLPVVPAASAAVEDWPMLRFAAEPDRSRAIWDDLPRQPWALGGRPKPAATVLATAGGADISDDASAVIAAMPYGLGKVLWVGTDGTWRWRHRVGDAYHHRFWGQVVRWANASKLAAGNRLVRFGPLRHRSAEGQSTPIRAQFADDAPGIAPGLLVAARVFRAKPGARAGQPLEPDGPALAVVPLRPSPDQPRVFDAQAPALPPGLYVVMLDAPGLDGMPTAGAPLEVAASETPERVELSASRDALARLAAPNDGRVFAVDEVAEIADRLEARSEPKARVESATLWDGPVALGLFFAIVAGEWALRKRVGLP
jgi:hypothetical protein